MAGDFTVRPNSAQAAPGKVRYQAAKVFKAAGIANACDVVSL
jgi:hypothetical protein